jgi:ribosomal protein S18 acetylase RimI-like enzyme
MTTSDPVPISLRPANVDDREFLWRLHRATMREYVDKTWGWDDNWQRERFDEQFDPALLQIIEWVRQPVGYVSVRREADEILLASIEVAPEFQNRGIGSRLVLGLLDEANREQLAVRLFVLKVNPARRLYERLGFQCIEETETHYVMRRQPGTAV